MVVDKYRPESRGQTHLDQEFHPVKTRKASVSPPNNMQQLQILGVLSIFLLLLDPSQCSPLTAQCVEHTYCSSTLKEYHAQLISLPSRINERSLAAWSYEENIDLDRVPQIIYEANCLNTHSCKSVDSSFSLESIPITIKMPFLRKNPRCPTYALEFEDVNIACICATSRQN